MADSFLIPVRLQLKETSTVAMPTLWVVENRDGKTILGELAQNFDEETISELLWFQSGLLSLFFWNKKNRPPLILDSAQTYVADPRLGNLFIPEGYRLTPIFRADFLRNQLVLTPDRLTWLSRSHSGLVVKSIDLSALKPVQESLSYQRPQQIPQQARSFASNPFRFLAFQEETPAKPLLAGSVVLPLNTIEAKEKQSGLLDRVGVLSRAIRWASRIVRRPPDSKQKQPIVEEFSQEVPLSTGRFETVVSIASADTQIAKLEREFLVQAQHRTSSEIAEAWERLSMAYETAGAYSEAALTWLLAVWEEGEKAPQRAWGWLRAEARAARGEVRHLNPREWLEKSPSPKTTRVLAAWVVWAQLQPTVPEEFRELAPQIQTRLAEGENSLPVRAAWLARRALARLAQGDVLLLAKAADRLLNRWVDGPISDLDVPPFLRFPTQAAQARHRHARSWIIQKRELVHNWLQRIWSNMPFPIPGHAFPKSLAPFGLEIDVPLTRSYADVLLAWGAAKFGENTISQQFFQLGRQNLPSSQPHELLLEFWKFRIEQARRSRNLPLPQELIQKLNTLDTLPKYAIERWFSSSKILQPSQFVEPTYFDPKNAERLNAFRSVRECEEYLRAFPKEIVQRYLRDFLVSERVLARTQPLVRDHILDRVRELIFDPTLDDPVRTQMCLGYVNSLHFQPVRVVVARLEELFSRMNRIDFFGTVNRYFCLPALMILEGAIRSLVPPDLEPGSPARRWLETDEWLVLKKIRAELQLALRQSGIE